MKFRLPIPLVVFALLLGCSSLSHAAFKLGGGEDYALLFEGFGGHTLQITNVTISGNVGVAYTGKATDSGPATINGGINFVAANTHQFSNNNNSNTITDGVHYSVADVASSMTFVNSLSQTLFNTAGTSVTIGKTASTIINASAASIFTVNGQSVHVFDASGFKNDNSHSLTINGSAGDLVAINLDGLGNIQIHGGITFTGGITSDNVIFNLGGGNYTTMTGGKGLDINNNGGKDGTARGIFLDPNGAIRVTNATVLGRVFGGDSHDFQFVSGSHLTAPANPVPDVGYTLALLAIGLASLEIVRRSGHSLRRLCARG